MSLIRGCDSCDKAIIGLSWWSIRLRDTRSKSVMKYDLCDTCKRKVLEMLGIRKNKKVVVPQEAPAPNTVTPLGPEEDK